MTKSFQATIKTEDYESIKKACKAQGLSYGKYIVGLHYDNQNLVPANGQIEGLQNYPIERVYQDLITMYPKNEIQELASQKTLVTTDLIKQWILVTQYSWKPLKSVFAKFHFNGTSFLQTFYRSENPALSQINEDLAE